MILLIAGLIVFIGIHSIRIVSDASRTRFIEKYSDSAWKGMYSLVSLVGLVLIVYGYQQTRLEPVYIWYPPAAMVHIASLLMLFSFVSLAAAYVPGNAIKAKLAHPMLIGIKIWAIAHLLANGRLGDMLLFTVFLVWAVIDFIACRRRDRARASDNTISGEISSNLISTIVTVVVGVAAYMVFAVWLHIKLIGVSPFG